MGTRTCSPPKMSARPGWRHEHVKRVIVVGPGASGKSTLAVRLGQITGLPVTELDNVF